ncbi:MAG: M14 family zinc carboxypeptidase [Actinomycetota bacterium]
MPVLRVLMALMAALPVGHSVQGRAIRPVVLGSAPPAHRLLVVGCIHGNETAGMAITRALVAAGAERGAEIVVVPAVNPDGCLGSGARGNAHGVDLNRNFPSNWARIGRPGSLQYSGPHALSEPESRYVVSLVRALQPAVTIVFHQHEDVVRAWGHSRATARRFAALLDGVLPYRDWMWPYGTESNWQNHAFADSASFVVELPAGPVPASLVPGYVRALRALARVGYVR